MGEMEGTAQKQEQNHQLKPTTFALLLSRLYRKRVTGLLQLERDSVQKAVYFKRGYPIFSRSNLVRESLGQMLVRQKLISPEECEAGLALAREKKCYLGTALIEQQKITPHQLHDVLKHQVEEKLLEVFSWTHGSYHFVTARDFRSGITSIEMSPAGLLLQGMRHYTSTEQLDTLLLPMLRRYPVFTENPEQRFQDLHFSAKDESILSQCIGCMTVEQIIALNPLSKKEVKSLLAALFCAGMLEALEQPVSDSCPVVDLPESKEERMAREAFLKEYDQVMGQNYFEIFGVKPGAAREEIRSVYFRMAKKYHPDRFSQKEFSEQLLDKVTELFQHITRAYETLMDPAERKRYLESSKTPSAPTKSGTQDLVQAELAFRKGEILVRRREYAQAVHHLRQAVASDDKEAEYLCLYAWSLYKANPTNRECSYEAHEKLLKAKEMNPQLYRPHLYLAFLYKDNGRSAAAQREFELAIQCNPDCTEALRELRLMDMRQEQQPEKKGFWKTVLGK